MKKIDFLDERSDFVKEVLETPPNNIITWGNTFFLFFILLIFLLSWFIKYPDVVVSEVTITTKNPPIYLSTKTEGKIDSILKLNKQFAKKGDWLTVIGSNANIKHVRILDSILSKIKLSNYNIDSLIRIELPILNLGEIQSDYNKMIKSTFGYKYYKGEKNFSTQTELNDLRVNQYSNLINSAIMDKNIAVKELEVAKINLDRNKILLDKGVIALQEYESVQLKYLQAKRVVQNNISNITQIKSQKANLLSENSNFEYTEGKNQLNTKLNILEAVKLTELTYSNWLKKHVLQSTISGEVNYLNYFTNNQYVKVGENLLSVNPKNTKEDYFAIAKMPLVNSGKVKLNQKVNIKSFGFPEKEYGVILGRINDIAEVPNEDYYLIKIQLDNGLETTFKKELSFKQNINGYAEIITDDLRLIERFIYSLIKPFN